VLGQVVNSGWVTVGVVVSSSRKSTELRVVSSDSCMILLVLVTVTVGVVVSVSSFQEIGAHSKGSRVVCSGSSTILVLSISVEDGGLPSAPGLRDSGRRILIIAKSSTSSCLSWSF
jgi:hypothetical protein